MANTASVLGDLEEFLAEQEAQQPDTSTVATLKRGREWRQAIDWAREHTKYIVVIGGVISGLGKGIAAASIGKLLNSRLMIVPIKCDGYLNTDPGTMNPIEHGEVFVLDDGGEVDMDFGHYERFLGVTCRFEWNLTMGKVYKTILEQEREGFYLGQTVQLIPHVTDVIKEWFYEIPGRLQADIGLIEIGGTVGDMENELYLEAVRQLRQEVGEENVLIRPADLHPHPGRRGGAKIQADPAIGQAAQRARHPAGCHHWPVRRAADGKDQAKDRLVLQHRQNRGDLRSRCAVRVSDPPDF